MFKKIAHIGIAVNDINASAELFGKLFGKAADHFEHLPEHKVNTALFAVGESSVELTEATDPESPIARFIEKRGEGVHHVSFIVDDIKREVSRLKGLGFQLIDEKPRLGADGYYVAFLHPKSTNGVLIELSQKTS
jgi:methylmalonyl-CoA/ethylmalonyl-CoA epimerase